MSADEREPANPFESDLEQEQHGPAWDADDPRRQEDQMAPPAEPCECYCLHCQRTFMSDGIWFQKVIGDPQGFKGFWMCPTPNCDGAGFTFDIFPTDPNHPANEGWHYYDDDDEDEEWDEDEDELDHELNPDDVGTDASSEYDPRETKYKQLDEQLGDGEDDLIEGDEWKLGLEPGQSPPPQMFWSEEARKQWEQEQKRYDSPDERPRELDWSDRKDREGFRDEDIPF